MIQVSLYSKSILNKMDTQYYEARLVQIFLACCVLCTPEASKNLSQSRWLSFTLA